MFRNRLYYKEIDWIVKRILSVQLALSTVGCLAISLGGLLFSQEWDVVVASLVVLFVGLCCGVTAWCFHRSTVAANRK